MAKPINEQVVVITGASSGIGRETALHLARKGAKVVVSSRKQESLDELVEEIRSAGGEAAAVHADVASYPEVQALARSAVDAYGRIDTWVNNAGVLIVGEFEKTDLEEARRLFDVNFWGEYHGCLAAIDVMKQQGAGTIVNVTSVTAKRPLPLMPVYSASKAALNGLSEALRAELKGTGIELCIVMPATIDTPLYDHARSKEGVATKPAPPIYPPSEVARAIEKAAVNPQREIFAGPAGLGFAIGNALMPGMLDKLLARFIRPALLTDEPEPAHGNDNIDHPAQGPETSSGGWRGRRYKSAELAVRIAMGGVALLVLRKLVRG
ncbi:MAG TPA: SDR family oxidoreductase [Chloroflexia bacterium]|nr:SDR family oxidoreductase [Chloroflexia bacterium]